MDGSRGRAARLSRPPEKRAAILPFSSCSRESAALSPVHRSRDAVAPSLGVSSLDFGLRLWRGPFFLGDGRPALRSPGIWLRSLTRGCMRGRNDVVSSGVTHVTPPGCLEMRTTQYAIEEEAPRSPHHGAPSRGPKPRPGIPGTSNDARREHSLLRPALDARRSVSRQITHATRPESETPSTIRIGRRADLFDDAGIKASSCRM